MRSDADIYILFVLGGVTYQEAKHIGELNKKNNKWLYLGGSSVLNSKMFIEDFLGENLNN